MLPSQKPFAILAAIVLAAVIVWLIRRRRLREEYALLWLMVAAGVVALALFYPLVKWLALLTGAVNPTSALFICALLFLLIVSLHFSVVHSRVKDQIKALTQEIALLRKDLEDAADPKPSQPRSPAPQSRDDREPP